MSSDQDQKERNSVLGERGKELAAKGAEGAKGLWGWAKQKVREHQEREREKIAKEARDARHIENLKVVGKLRGAFRYLDDDIKKLVEIPLSEISEDAGYETAEMLASDEIMLAALERALEKKSEADEAASLAAMGERRKKRLREIEELFANTLNTYRVDASGLTKHAKDQSILNASYEAAKFAYTGTSIDPAKVARWDNNDKSKEFYRHYHRYHIARTLEDMQPAERAVLRLTHVLEQYLEPGDVDWEPIRAAIAWDEGKGALLPGPKPGENASIHHHATVSILLDGMISSRTAVDRAREIINDMLRLDSTPDVVRMEIQKGLFRGANWLSRSDNVGTMYDGAGADRLILGRMEDGEALTIEGDGSLLTVAPPGAGKTQTQVLPNLLRYPGPAIVLDVKGECYELTADWRRENVGPVYRFAPEDTEGSAGFNPLMLVDPAPTKIVRDAKTLARLMLPSSPKGGDDAFWVDSAMNVVAASIVYLVGRSTDDWFPCMSDLIDLMSPTEEEKRGIAEFCEHHDSRSIQRLWRTIQGIPEKTRDNIYTQAQTSLSPWEGDDIEALSVTTGWDPRDFCYPEANPTLYVCISPAQLPVLAPMLRVLFGMHLNLMVEESERGRDDLPVLFMLDELPQLGHMPPVLQGIEVGRSKGVKVWGFCQTLDQIREHYGDAQRLNSVVKAVSYMNPDAKTSKTLVDSLGDREGLLDGQRKPLVEVSDLTGPEWREKVLVISSGMPPAQIHKWPLHDQSHPLHRRARWDAS